MSQEDVAVVRALFAATNERDFARALAHHTHDVELVVPPGVGSGGGTFKGRDALGRWFGDWFRSFQPDYRFDLHEVRDLGHAVVAVAGTAGRGRTSGAEVSGEVVWLYEFRAGKIAHLQLYGTLAEALHAASESE